MICNFSTKFPDGSPTNFIEKIVLTKGVWFLADNADEKTNVKSMVRQTIIEHVGILRAKPHTIRKGHRWRPGMKAHIYTGSRTKAAKCHFILEVKGVQDITIKWSEIGGDRIPMVWIDGRLMLLAEQKRLAIADGFRSRERFFEWFSDDFDGQIIHFTDLRY